MPFTNTLSSEELLNCNFFTFNSEHHNNMLFLSMVLIVLLRLSFIIQFLACIKSIVSCKISGIFKWQCICTMFMFVSIGGKI